MAENIKVGFALQPETVERIAQIAERTFRSKGAVIDWLVDEAWLRLYPSEAVILKVPDEWKAEEA